MDKDLSKLAALLEKLTSLIPEAPCEESEEMESSEDMPEEMPEMEEDEDYTSSSPRKKALKIMIVKGVGK